MKGKDTWQGLAVLLVLVMLAIGAGQCGENDLYAPHCPTYSWCD